MRFPAGHPTVTVSAIETSGINVASRVVDGDTNTDWAAIGYGEGDWWRATWAAPLTVDRVKLFPRDGACENYGLGRVRFSDGTSVPFDLRANIVSTVPVTVDFTAKVRLLWLEVVSDGGGGTCSPGLAEAQAFDTATSTTANLLRPASGATYSASSASSPAANAADGAMTSDWAATGYTAGDWWRVDWTSAQALDRIKLYPRDGACDNFGQGTIHFSDASTVAFDLRTYTDSATPLVVDFARRSGISWLKVVSDSDGGTCNPGLAEVEAFDTAPPPVASIPDLDAASDTASLAETTHKLVLRPDADVSASAMTYSSGTVGWSLIDEPSLNTADWLQTSANGQAFFSFPDTGLSANDTITNLVIRANVTNSAPAYPGQIVIRRPSDGEIDYVWTVGQNPAADQTVTLPKRTWDDLDWTVADLDALQVGMTGPSSLAKFRVRMLWVEITYTTHTPPGHTSDNLTSDSRPTLSGTVEEGAQKVELFEGTELLATDETVGSGAWSATTGRLSEGSHTIHAVATGGNGATHASGALVVVVDTDGDPRVAPASDTGAKPPTALTRRIRPVADVATSGDVVLSGGTTAWNLVDEALLRTYDNVYVRNGSVALSFADPALADGDLIDSVTVTAYVRNPASAGTGTIFVRNPSSGTTHTVATIGQNHPPLASVTLPTRPWDLQPWTLDDVETLQVGAACGCASLPKFRVDQLFVDVNATAFREGDYGRDGITSDTTPTLTGANSSVAGRVEVSEDEQLLASDTAVADGAWEATLPALSAGSHSIEVDVFDADDLRIAHDELTVTVDTTAPAAPSTPDLDTASDTGASSTDDITSDTTPTFSGTNPTGAVQVELFAGDRKVGTDTTVEGSTWSITSVRLAEDVHAVTARSVDTAGNSTASGALSTDVVENPLRLRAYTTPAGDVGSVNYVSVVTQNEAGHPIDTFAGAITLTSTDPAVTFPDGASYTMTPGNDGTGHTFRVRFGTPGNHTVTASASGTSAGKTAAVVVADGDLELVLPDAIHPDVPFAVRVVPRKASGLVARQYASQVTLSSSDANADFGSDVDDDDRYAFDCGCGDGHAFATRLPSLGNHSITVTDEFGHTDTVTFEVTPAPTSGSDPIEDAAVVRWPFGNRAEYYVDAAAALTITLVEDFAQSGARIAEYVIPDGERPAGTAAFAAESKRDGHIVASEWIDIHHHVVHYLNADGRPFSRTVERYARFDDVPTTVAPAAMQLDPGGPIASWTIVSRTNEQTTIEFDAREPFHITSVKYTFQGTIWEPGNGEYYVPQGVNQIALSNDPASCYFGFYKDNNHILLEYVSGGDGNRKGRLAQQYIVDSAPGYTDGAACSSNPLPGSAGSQTGDYFIRQAAERPMTGTADPIDVADGFLHAPVTDVDLGGLAPALEFSRTYDGRTAEDSNGAAARSTLLGPGWTTSLDWSIADPAAPDVIEVQAGDGGSLHFRVLTNGTYAAMGGIPFTFEAIAGGFELRRLDRTGYRFGSDGRLAAVLDRSDREMTLAYDGGGHLESFTDAAGRTATVTTDAEGRITGIALPGGRSVSYTYTSGRLRTATDLAGTTLEYITDIRGRLTSVKDGQGRALLRNVYDGGGRVVEQVDAVGSRTHLTFDADRGTTQSIGPRGDVATFCTEESGNLTRRFDTADGATTIDYDSFGHPRLLTDQLGARTWLRSDASGRLLEATDTLGRTATIDYNAAGDPEELVDAQGRTLDVSYTAGLPVDLTLTSGTESNTVAEYTWDFLDQLETVTEPGGAVTTLDHDADGYVSSVTDGEHRETTFSTDARGFVTAVVDPLGNELGGTPTDHDWLYTYDDMGRITSAEDPTGAETTYTYDAMGRVATMMTPAGLITSHTYDDAGRRISESVATPPYAPAVTEYEYDAAGNLTAVTDAEDRRTEFRYDMLGRAIEMEDADGRVWETEYDAKGRVISRTDPTSRTTEYRYDAADRLTRVIDPGGHETTYEYDDGDRLVRITDELGGETEYTYDWLGRRTSQTNAVEGVTEFDYDAAGDLVSVTDPLDRLTEFEYDDTHRLTLVIDALLGETTYEYDAAGRLILRENARNHAEEYAYDAAGRPTTTTDPLTNVWQTVYDPAGRIDHTIDAEGQQTDYAYDELGRVETITPDSGPDIDFTYDLTGRRLTMADGNGTTAYEYDPVGRLTETTRGGRAVGYGYDHAGRLTEETYPGSLGSVAIAYDMEGRLDTITDWDSRVTTFGYDDLDRVTSIARPGDLLSSFGYDALGRVSSIQHAYDGAPVIELGYEYDAAGNVVERTDDQGTATFSYDDLDRLTAADYPGTDDYAYAHDAAGNLTSITTPSGTTTHSYDAADRISDTGYVYDDNGALLTDGTRTFTYDALGRLTGVTGPALSSAYELDGDGNRWSETVDSVTIDFDLDLRGLPTALTANGKSYLPGMPSLGHADGGDWLNALADAQGSVLETVDEAGATSTLVRYDPYGGMRPGSSAVAGIGYTGEWQDAAGLVNLRFRAYDPALGRFLSRDTFAGLDGLPATANRHCYALGNPLRFADASGHFPTVSGPAPGTCPPSTNPQPAPGDHLGQLQAGAQGIVDSGVTAVRGTVDTVTGGINCLWNFGECLVPGAQKTVQFVADGVHDAVHDPGKSAGDGLISLGNAIGDASDRLKCGGAYGIGEAWGGFFFAGITRKIPLKVPVVLPNKIVSQLAARGWTDDLVREVVAKPGQLYPVWDLTSGTRQAATAYARGDNFYVVVNDVTGEVVQISDRADALWKPVWKDPTFQR